MNKAARTFAKPLRDIAGKVMGETFARQGFASAELVTRWADIVGAEIAAHSEPMRIQWNRPTGSRSHPAAGEAREAEQEAATLVLRVEGPAAIEIQHLAPVICERVNRFLGWRAVVRLALRQAPLRRTAAKQARPSDPSAVARIAADLGEIDDGELRDALARLGAAIRRSS